MMPFDLPMYVYTFILAVLFAGAGMWLGGRPRDDAGSFPAWILYAVAVGWLIIGLATMWMSRGAA